MTAGNRVILCILVATGSAFALSPSGHTLVGPSTIRVTDLQKDYRLIGGDGGAPAIGDLELVRASLFNARITDRSIGHSQLLCTYVDRRARNCSATYFLPRGKIVVGGVIDSRLLYELAVIGGTGVYANARGTLTVTATSMRPRRDVLIFRLVG